ncbi:MAG TPA: hypothetical protein VFK57_18480 [Vicinamibacterales bacterium]|nr:hypothetical protein [Vicinamibacterales bacterium]
MRPIVTGALCAAVLAASALLPAACASSSGTAPPAAAPAAAPPPAPATTSPTASAQPPRAETATTPAAQRPAPSPTGVAAPAPGAEAAADPFAAAAGRGRGRGNPPPPPPPLPAVMPRPPKPIVSAAPPTPDPRVGLKAGWWDAGAAAWNMNLVSTTPPTGRSLGATHSDLAFTGKYTIQGHYNGFDMYDISNAEEPVLVQQYVCPASQNDVSVYGNLLFMSSEAPNSRADCGFGGVPDPVSKERVRGIRIFDISDIKKPKLVTSVQTCRGSHTHTVARQAGDKDNVYIYISGTSSVRSAEELPGCQDGGRDDPNSARFRLEVIKVPLATPQNAAVVSSPRVFQDLPVAPRNAERDALAQREREQQAAQRGQAGAGAGGAAGAAGGGRGRGNQGPPTGPNQCHDITLYSDVGLAGGACAGLGLLLDVRDVTNPKRIEFAADQNMSFWHSATFSNDGRKVLFSDEWGGGSAPRCRDTDKPEWGANAIFTIEDNKLKFRSYYKLPAPQTAQENCVAHNGSLIPVPGRDVMVQGWYQGGLTVFDWTDPDHPKEIAFYDRGPVAAERLVSGGSWSAYWYNGLIVSSEIARGLDIYELVPSPLLSANELAAAKTVKMTYYNTQDQQKFVWPPSFVLARAYLDQLERSAGLAATTIASARTALSNAERRSGAQRRTALTQLAAQLTSEAASAKEQDKVRTLAAAVTDLATATK